jgi:hypothetical protein
MPYEVAFSKPIGISDREQYINDCCVGGDIVVDRLLPAIRQRYTGIQTNQEDWGWFIWFRKSGVRLAVDVFTDDPDTGAFRIRLTSTIKKLLFEKVADTPELDELRALVESELRNWQVADLAVSHADD